MFLPSFHCGFYFKSMGSDESLSYGYILYTFINLKCASSFFGFVHHVLDILFFDKVSFLTSFEITHFYLNKRFLHSQKINFLFTISIKFLDKL